MQFSVTRIDHANGYREWAIVRPSDGRICVLEEASELDAALTAYLLSIGEEDEQDYFG